MRHLLLWSIAALMLSAHGVVAAPTLTLFDAIVPTNAVTVVPGSSFTLTVRMSTDVSMLGFSAYLEDTSFTTASHFFISNRTWLSSSPFKASEENTDTVSLVGDAVDDATLDLGYVKDVGSVSAGTWDLMTLTLQAAANVQPGPYSLRFNADSVLAGVNFQPVDFSNLQTSTYTVTVVAPEPETLIWTLPLTWLFTRRISRKRRRDLRA